MSCRDSTSLGFSRQTKKAKIEQKPLLHAELDLYDLPPPPGLGNRSPFLPPFSPLRFVCVCVSPHGCERFLGFNVRRFSLALFFKYWVLCIFAQTHFIHPLFDHRVALSPLPYIDHHSIEKELFFFLTFQ